MKSTYKALLTTTISGFFLTAASAVTITSLYNTGVDASGNVLADGTIGDPHYTLTSVPAGTTEIRVRSSAGGSPIGPFIGDNTSSRWIGPNNAADLSSDIGDFIYQTTFDLTGFDFKTASINGGWSTDNSGLTILLNGVDTGASATDYSQFSLGFAPFSVTSGFQDGINTLAFVVNNGGGPTALRVEMAGDARTLTSDVPEGGATIVLLGGVIVLFGSLQRKLAPARITA